MRLVANRKDEMAQDRPLQISFEEGHLAVPGRAPVQPAAATDPLGGRGAVGGAPRELQP